MKKLILPLVVLALVATAAVVLFRDGERKYLTASFPRAVSVFEGSDVRILGVRVGKVEEVTPAGTEVEVTMWYDGEVDVPRDAKAVIVAPSVVGDRFVQLTPVYTGGPKLADGATLTTESTSTPLELDEIYQSLDDLTVALGPTGANREGALSELLRTTAENFGGQGERFNQTIHDLGEFTGTLDNNREELFGAAARLEGFISTLAENDQTVRRFNESMASVSEVLAGERTELAASLKNLATAMGQVSTFVEDNQASLRRNVVGLNKVARILVRQRKALEEVFRVAPVALTNLGHTYNPQSGTLDTRANFDELVNQIGTDPSTLLCGLVSQGDESGQVCDLIRKAVPRAGAFGDHTPVRAPDPWDPTLGGLVEVAS